MKDHSGTSRPIQRPDQAPVKDHPKATSQHTAGAFDIRNIIGLLLGIYGVVLVLAYFFLDPGVNPDTGMAKDAINNLWTGLALVLAAIIFMAWAKFRPIRVDAPAAAASTETPATTNEVK